MIELGLVTLIQAGLGDPPIAPGGYCAQIPKDLIGTAGLSVPMAWTYTLIASEATYVLTGQDALTSIDLRIDCHGTTAANAQVLARAIERTLRSAFPVTDSVNGGTPLTLSDPDQTVVYGIFRRGPCVDGFSDANRTYVRTLEYMVTYDQQ